MCAIFGSYDLDKLEELAEINAYRGQLSYSLSEYNTTTQQLIMRRKCLGAFTLEGLEMTRGMYYIGHIQAPTTGASAEESIHPSVRTDGHDLLWHNGILKEKYVSTVQAYFETSQSWDSGLLHNLLTNVGWDKLSEVDGTFSCLRYFNKDLYLFRNEISPMFVDDQLNISSTKFENGTSTEPNKVLKINFTTKALNEVSSFTTKENPYYFGNL